MNRDYLSKHKDGIFLFILYSFYAVGILGHLVDATFPYMMILTPFVLLVFGVAVLLRTTGMDHRLLLWCLGAYVFTFTVEALGVHSGAIFGEYNYGNTLGVKLLSVPLVIGFNWVIVVLGAIAIARRISRNILYSALLAALFTAIFDVPLEVVAVNLDYWQWAPGFVPFQNYVAWFVVAFIVALSFNYLRLETKGKVIIHYFFIQFLFFILIDLMIYTNLL
jgi:putative membrane protein